MKPIFKEMDAKEAIRRAVALEQQKQTIVMIEKLCLLVEEIKKMLNEYKEGLLSRGFEVCWIDQYPPHISLSVSRVSTHINIQISKLGIREPYQLILSVNGYKRDTTEEISVENFEQYLIIGLKEF